MVHNIVAAMIVQSDRILLGRRSPGRAFYPNVWDLFGGHVEPGERPDQSLVRELQEELGITSTQWMDLGTIMESVPEHDEIPSNDLIVQLYKVTDWVGTPLNRQPQEHSTIQWFSYAEAIQLDLAHPFYPRLFARYLLSVTDQR